MGTNSKANRDATEALERQARGIGYVLIGFDRVLENADQDNLYVTGISLRPPGDDRPEWLLIVRAMGDGQAVVAFHAASSFVEVVKGFCDRFQNRTLRWKEDQYAGH